MRILVFNWRDMSHPHAGGAEVFTHEVCRHWVASGHHVTVFAQTAENLAAQDVLDGVDIVRRGNRYSVYREAKKWYTQQVHEPFDLVIDEVNTRPFGCPRWVRDAPVVALIHQLAHDVWFHEFRRPLALLGRFVLEPMWLRRYRNVPTITVSPSSKASLEDHGLRQLRVVHEGMDFDRMVAPAPKHETPTVVFCGRLAANKRPDHAIEAFRLFQADRPDAHLYVIGQGPMQERLQATAPPNVTFVGRVADAEKLRIMSSAHALITTSVREGWGLVVSEAAAMGTPAIGYEVPGLRDSIAAAGGVLVEATPEALAEALREYIPVWMKETPPIDPKGVVGWNIVADEMLRAAIDMDIDVPMPIDLREPIVLPRDDSRQSTR